MAKLLLVCVLSFVVALAYGDLKCYTCLNNCKLDVNEQTTCGKDAAGKNEAACLKFVFKDKGITNVTRKCILQDPKHPYECNVPQGAEKISCDICKEDLCNSANGIKFNTYNILAATCSVLFVKFFLL